MLTPPTDPTLYARAKAIFVGARSWPRAERAAFARDACAEDAELQAVVEALLAADDDATGLRPGGFVDDLGDELIDSFAAPDGPLAGAVGTPPTGIEVPGYRVLRRIAIGGMGAVYEAEQETPRRRVALKVLRPELSSPEMVRRFAYEAEVLARLDHPRIARLYATGTTTAATGSLPYLAMEFVDGTPITTWAIGRLDARGLADLLARTCAAVADAHVAGVVHRDLKPANVLVDAEGRPKVLDFGIARIAEGGAASMHTAAGTLLGTLGYMSPEQARDDAARVDARSDVFALGAIAWELFAGRPMRDVARLPIAAALAEVASGRSEPLSRAAPGIDGDLALVVTKCLDPDPARRYVGVAALHEDLRRWLAGEPIAARPPTAAYILRSYVRRHRLVVAAAAAVLAAIVAGAVLAASFAVRARESARRADARASDALDAGYLAAMQAALGNVAAGDRDAARRSLATAPPSRRGWEWRHATAALDDARSRTTFVRPLDELHGVSSDGTKALGVRDGQVVLVDVTSGADVFAQPIGITLRAVAFAGRGTIVVALVAGESGLRRIDGTSGVPLAPSEPLPFEADGLLGDPDADVAYAVASRAKRAGSGGGSDRSWLVARVAADGTVGPAVEFPDGYDRLAEARPSPSALAVAPTTRRALFVGHGLETIVAAPDLGSHDRISLGHDSGAVCAAWSADGRRFATGGSDQGLSIYDAASLDLSRKILAHAGVVAAVALAADGARVVTCDRGGEVRVFDARSGAREAAHALGPVHGGARLRFAEHGRTFSAVTAAGRTTWTVGDANDPFALRPHRSREDGNRTPYVYGVAWSPDGRRLATAGWDWTVRVSDATTGDLLSTLELEASGMSVAWSPDGRRIAATTKTGQLETFDARTGRPLARWRDGRADSRFARVRYTPDGVSLLVQRRDGAVVLLDAAGLGERRVARGAGGRPRTFDPSPGGDSVCVALSDGTVEVRDVSTGALRWTARPSSAEPTCVAYSTDGARLAVSGVDGSVHVLDASDGTERTSLALREDPVYAVAWSPDGSRLATGCRDATVGITTEDGRPVATLRGHTEYVYDLRFSPDGATLATASGDNSARLFDTRTAAVREAAAELLRAREAALEPRVKALLGSAASPSAAADALEADASLSPDDRHAAGNALLRLCSPP